ncbi:MAG: hypothetical protein K2P93_04965 [Alphaproteobacteria bacterium]|nr:hypothetical protein [Alphaproteobacteria bacterium]
MEEIQTDADHWLRHYNEQRPHSGKYCYGKTPWQTFLDAKPLAIEKNLDTLIETSDNFTPIGIAA